MFAIHLGNPFVKRSKSDAKQKVCNPSPKKRTLSEGTNGRGRPRPLYSASFMGLLHEAVASINGAHGVSPGEVLQQLKAQGLDLEDNYGLQGQCNFQTLLTAARRVAQQKNPQPRPSTDEVMSDLVNQIDQALPPRTRDSSPSVYSQDSEVLPVAPQPTKPTRPLFLERTLNTTAGQHPWQRRSSAPQGLEQRQSLGTLPPLPLHKVQTEPPRSSSPTLSDYLAVVDSSWDHDGTFI